MTDKLHPIVGRAGAEFADGKLERREFLRIATLLGVAAPVAYGMAGLTLPAMAQTAAILVYSSSDDNKGKITYFVGIDNTKFRKPVVPGDQLRLELEVINCRRGIYTFSGKAYVDGKLVTESELRATFADKQS